MCLYTRNDIRRGVKMLNPAYKKKSYYLTLNLVLEFNKHSFTMMVNRQQTQAGFNNQFANQPQGQLGHPTAQANILYSLLRDGKSFQD